MDKENKTLEGLFRAKAVGGKTATPEFLVMVQRVHTIGVHVAVFPAGVDGDDALDFTVVDNKLIPHFVTRNGNGMSFGDALDCIQQGDRVARLRWNGKDMFLFLVPGSKFKVNRPPLLGIYKEGTEIDYCPHIDMRTADGSIVPWLASQSDLLSQDWVIVQAANGSDKKPKSK